MYGGMRLLRRSDSKLACRPCSEQGAKNKKGRKWATPGPPVGQPWANPRRIGTKSLSEHSHMLYTKQKINSSMKYYYGNLLANQNITAKTDIVWASDFTTLQVSGEDEKTLQIFLCIDLHTNYILG